MEAGTLRGKIAHPSADFRLDLFLDTLPQEYLCPIRGHPRRQRRGRSREKLWTSSSGDVASRFPSLARAGRSSRTIPFGLVVHRTRRTI